MGVFRATKSDDLTLKRGGIKNDETPWCAAFVGAMLELTCPAWTAPILICNGFTDRTCVTEDARTLTFTVAAIDVALPKKDSRGAQNITIAIDNVNGEAQSKIDEAMTAEQRVSATLRTYLLSDLTAPAEAPYRMTVQMERLLRWI